ncbi:hypothetical protein LTSEMIS_2319 [Salmonella enterica subsp. enterica serovar Mississippi str. A4-633]|nr:hypothetical protein LTSEMIS_2319 [Salmonella enterica subsp. enterica serovar Mississippi str. A4-633]
MQLPSVIGGYPPSTLKIKMVAKISAFTACCRMDNSGL